MPELITTAQEAYERQRAYFSRPSAKLARFPRLNAVMPPCLYRSRDKDGRRRCAVGCLIPKAAYRRTFEGHAVRALLNDGRLVGVFGNPPGHTLPASATDLGVWLSITQHVHDREATNAADFVLLLDVAARKFGLDVG